MGVPSATALAARLAAGLGFLRPGARGGPGGGAAARASRHARAWRPRAWRLRAWPRLGVACSRAWPPSASLLPSALASGFASSFSAPARLRLLSLSVLKSVSYQPPPFRRNTGADTSFFSLLLAAGGALGQRLVADLLHHLAVELAGLAFVFVERHSALCLIVGPRGSIAEARPQPVPAARGSLGARRLALLQLGEAELAVLGADADAVARARTRPAGCAAPAGSRSAAGWRASAAARRRPDRTRPRRAGRAPRHRARGPCCAPAGASAGTSSWMSTMARICSVPSGWNTTMSSMRLMNSGRKLCCTTSITALFILA